jgi:aspartate kinase
VRGANYAPFTGGPFSKQSPASFWTPGGYDVIDVHVMREPPSAGQGIIEDSRLILDTQPGVAQGLGKFLRSDKLIPVVGSTRHPAQHIFGAENRESEALQGPVERCGDKHAAGPHHRGGLVEEASDVAHMLNDLHGQDNIEDPALGRKLLSGDAPVIDGKVCFCGMVLRGLDVVLRRIDRGHAGAKPGEGFRENAGAAPYIEDRQPLERGRRAPVARPPLEGKVLAQEFAQIGDTDRVELVQRSHGAIRIPPLRAEPVETGNFLRIDDRIAMELFPACHGRIPIDLMRWHLHLCADLRSCGAVDLLTKNPLLKGSVFDPMPRLVMKFGGTSVANIERIRNVARHIARERGEGHDIAVVVSAMAGKTNELAAWCAEAAQVCDQREYDAVVASGEQVTAGLLAIVLQEQGFAARSWQGWQIPILTSNAHGSARIEHVGAAAILNGFVARGEVAVIAGFQGLHKESGRIATLGRGGSDTSAVAVAAAIGAVRCDIYTDVDGIYTTDPRIVPKAKRLDRIAFEEMLEMASLGAKVLQVRSVELAMVHKVKTFVRSSFDDPDGFKQGTLICGEEDILESQVVTSIAFSRDEAQITLRRVADRPGIAAAIFMPLAEANINVDMIIQVASEDSGETDITFTVSAADFARAQTILFKARPQIGFSSLHGANDVVKISAIGIGMRSHAGVAARAFKALAEKGINIRAITTSEIKLSVLIEAAYTELAVRTLHTLYGLDKA